MQVLEKVTGKVSDSLNVLQLNLNIGPFYSHYCNLFSHTLSLFSSLFGQSFRVLKADIDSVSLDQGGLGKSIVKLNGKGTLLAKCELVRTWAEQAQEFILG